MTLTKFFSTIWVLSTISFTYGQSGTTNYNLGFEQADHEGALPKEWFQWGSGYLITPDTQVVNSGQTAVKIAPGQTNESSVFGCIARAIPATYKANEIELIARMKLDNVHDGAAGLMIRIDGASGVLGFDNMLKRNIHGTLDWTTFSVKIPYPENPKVIYIGAILTGKGQLWVDDFEILLDGKDISEARVHTREEYPAEKDKEFDHGSGITTSDLLKLSVKDLAIVGRVWGYLKYYHPAVVSGNYNWDYELFRLMPKLFEANSQMKRNQILNEWISSLGHTDTEQSIDTIREEIKMFPDQSWINEALLGTKLTMTLKGIEKEKRTESSYYIGQVPGIGNPEFKNERPYADMVYPDAGFRLLSLYRYWNMIHYYFPYKDLIGEDWNQVLVEFIPDFVNAVDELEYKLTVLSLIARIHDTHANIWGADPTLDTYKGSHYPGIGVTFVEDKAVVTEYLNESGELSGIGIGDVIESINGKMISDIVAERLPYTPASNYATQLRDIARDLLRTNDSLVKVEGNSPERSFSKSLKTFGIGEINPYLKFQRTDTCFKLVEPEIAYLYPGTLKNEFIPTIMTEAMKMQGLIIDFRCYPSDFLVFTLGEYLLPNPIPFVEFSAGSITRPGLFTTVTELNVGRDNPDYYKGKVVIIVNELTQSSAEYHSMAFRVAPRAIVIGSTTAGADGNVSRIVLPGGIATMISGIGVYYPDGSGTQRVGIVPDIVVRPTIQGIREGRDELLERAISLIHAR